MRRCVCARVRERGFVCESKTKCRSSSGGAAAAVPVGEELLTSQVKTHRSNLCVYLSYTCRSSLPPCLYFISRLF